jgi:hypothetical protein
MLRVGEIFHKRDSLAKTIENHGNAVGRKAKYITKLSGGNGIQFKCVSYDEKAMECACSYSVYFAKSRKKCDNIKEHDINGVEIDNSVWFIPLKSKLCTTHTCLMESTNIILEKSSYTNKLQSKLKRMGCLQKFVLNISKIEINANMVLILFHPRQ